MAKRDNRTNRTKGGTMSATSSGTTTADAVEQRVVAFVEQLGRIAGAFQAKAEGWTDREALKKQIASVRDGAVDLLERLSGGAPNVAKKRLAAVAAPGRTAGRSGGVVDARGKKHRKPRPADPDATMANSQAAKMRMAKTMVKTNRRRGRA